MAGVDISRLSEEIIIWNTQEFAFVRLEAGRRLGLETGGVEGHRGHHAGERGQQHFECVDLVEHGLFVFLQITRVRGGQAFERGEQAGQVADEASGLAAREFGDVAEGRGEELWDLTDDDFIEVFREFLPAEQAVGVREVLSTECVRMSAP